MLAWSDCKWKLRYFLSPAECCVSSSAEKALLTKSRRSRYLGSLVAWRLRLLNYKPVEQTKLSVGAAHLQHCCLLLLYLNFQAPGQIVI
jgi:hypothetical protein